MPFIRKQTEQRIKRLIKLIVIDKIIKAERKNKMKRLTFDEYLKEKLRDPELKKEWDASEEEYRLINSLIKARVESGLTQSELSERSGINQANISKIENGVYNPTVNILRKLAEAMNMELKIEFIPKKM